MTPSQCRMARAALNWTKAELAEKSSVATNTVLRFEGGGDVRVSSLNAMREALTEAGVTFHEDGCVCPPSSLAASNPS